MACRQLPLIVVPGIQGRWEWMRPALDALRRTPDLGDGTVLSFSLNEENGVDDPFDQWTARIDTLLASTSAPQMILVGVSFGGLVAAHYAARHPDRVSALILISTPSPRMTLGHAEQQSLRHPILTLPLFAWRGVRRMLPEIIAARSTWPSRVSFMVAYLWQIARHPIAPTRMVRWIRAWHARDLASECGAIAAPTRIITGDRHLDRVVPVDSTLEYRTLIPHASHVTLPHTGHIGLVSRPEAFASLIREFVHALDDSRSSRSA